jgi:hypothetical protein
MKIKSERKCVACKKTKSIFSFGIIYAPRTPHDKGWLNKQCKSCYEEGGIDTEEVLIRKELKEKLDVFNSLKEEIKDIRCLLRHIEKKTIMKDADGGGDVIAKESSDEDALSSLFLE